MTADLSCSLVYKCFNLPWILASVERDKSPINEVINSTLMNTAHMFTRGVSVIKWIYRGNRRKKELTCLPIFVAHEC